MSLPSRPSLLLAACLAAAVPAWAVDTGEAPRSAPVKVDHLASARAAIEAQSWSVALRELDVAARDEPRNADVQNLLGYTYRKRSSPDLPKAIAHYEAALRLQPTHRGAHEYIGEAYLMDNKPAEAEKHLAQLEQICGGTGCEEYQDLFKSIAAYKSSH
ncbi:MAG: tetratricopeptide repeat protein [Ramlibacter sp.]